MKKYIKPNMEVNTIEMEEMIAASEVTGTTLDDLTKGDGDFAGGAVEGKDRGGSDWGGLW